MRHRDGVHNVYVTEVAGQVAGDTEDREADIAGKWFLSRVDPDVLGQVQAADG